jgi:DNA-binding NtrC family response regulator
MDSIPEGVIFGRPSAMLEVCESVRGVAGASVPVPLVGEHSAGKEVTAHLVTIARRTANYGVH